MGVLNICGSGTFPFCLIPATGLWDQSTTPVPNGAVGQGTFYPIGLSLDQAMRWYWQVEAWQCAASFVFAGTRSDGVTPSSFYDSLNDTLDATRGLPQNGLVCPNGFTAADDATFFALWGGASPYAYTWEGLIYPYLLIEFYDDYLTLSTAQCDSALAFPKPWPEPLTIDGQTLPLWYDERAAYDSTTGVPGDNGPWTQSKSGSATVTAVATY